MKIIENCKTCLTAVRFKIVNSRRAGFTIAELVLVIAIIGILTVIGSNTYRNQRNQFQFNDSLTQVISVINTARNYAIATRGYYNGTDTIIPKEGYGVFIDQDNKKLVLFANIDTTNAGINQYNSNEGVVDTGFEKEYFLPQDTIFVSLTGTDSNGTNLTMTNNQAVIIFRPPLADTFIAVNPDALPASVDNIVKITDLRIELQRLGAPAGTPNKVISINKIAGFPEIKL